MTRCSALLSRLFWLFFPSSLSSSISDLHWTGLCDDWGHRSIVTTIVTTIVTAQCLVVVALALKTDCDCHDQGISSLHSDSAARLILGMLYPGRHEVFAMSGAPRYASRSLSPKYASRSFSPRYASQIFISEICFPDLCLRDMLPDLCLQESLQV